MNNEENDITFEKVFREDILNKKRDNAISLINNNNFLVPSNLKKEKKKNNVKMLDVYSVKTKVFTKNLKETADTTCKKISVKDTTHSNNLITNENLIPNKNVTSVQNINTGFYYIQTNELLKEKQIEEEIKLAEEKFLENDELKSFEEHLNINTKEIELLKNYRNLPDCLFSGNSFIFESMEMKSKFEFDTLEMKHNLRKNKRAITSDSKDLEHKEDKLPMLHNYSLVSHNYIQTVIYLIS
jgi:hypothetical protein